MDDEIFVFMLKFLSKQDLKENFVFSPFSIMVILRCLTSAAKNESLKELQSLVTMEPNEFRKLLLKLTAGKSSFWTGTKVLAAPRANIKSEFKSELKYLLDVDTHIMDDRNETQKMLSEWITEKTNGKISPTQIDDDKLMYLINVVYWKAAWFYPFFSEDTKMRPFFSDLGETQIETMFGNMLCKRFAFDIQELHLSVLEMMTKSEYSLVIVKLPELKQGEYSLALRTLIEKFPEMEFANGRMNSQLEDVDVFMPKLNIINDMQIIKHLQLLGVHQVFEENIANLSNMTDKKDAYVCEIEHKAIFCADENGCEAAACTQVDVADGPGKHSVVNTPFLFMVMPKMNFTPIFSGVFNH